MNHQEFFFGSVPKASITDFVEWISPDLPFYDFLFVVLDSSRGERLSDCSTYLRNRLTKAEVEFGFDDNCLRIAGTVIKDVLRLRNVIVPFSAAYLIPTGSANAILRSYSETSESTKFIHTIPVALEADIKCIGAAGYISDGDGLNFVVAGNDLATKLQAHVNH